MNDMLSGGGEGINKDDVVRFFNALARGWDDEISVDKDKIEFILDKAEVRPGTRVLDVACGTGVLFPFYLERETSHVLAVDISPEMTNLADCCVVYNAFPHFPEPRRLVSRLAAWLKPNGRLTVAHSMSLAQLDRHHAGRAAKVSRAMLTAPELADVLSQWFTVDIAISDDEKYIVSGKLIAGA